MREQKDKRGKIEKALTKIKYNHYQANIQFLSHDTERLYETASLISASCKKIRAAIKGEKKSGKRSAAIKIRTLKERI